MFLCPTLRRPTFLAGLMATRRALTSGLNVGIPLSLPVAGAYHFLKLQLARKRYV